MSDAKAILKTYREFLGRNVSFEFVANTRSDNDLIVAGILVTFIETDGIKAAVIVDSDYLYLVKFPPPCMRTPVCHLEVCADEVANLKNTLAKISDIISLCKGGGLW